MTCCGLLHNLAVDVQAAGCALGVIDGMGVSTVMRDPKNSWLVDFIVCSAERALLILKEPGRFEVLCHIDVNSYYNLHMA